MRSRRHKFCCSQPCCRSRARHGPSSTGATMLARRGDGRRRRTAGHLVRHSHAIPDGPSAGRVWSFVLPHLAVIADFVLLLVTSVLWRRYGACPSRPGAAAARRRAIGAASLATRRAWRSPYGPPARRRSSHMVFAPVSALLFGVAAWLKQPTAGALEVRSAPTHRACATQRHHRPVHRGAAGFRPPAVQGAAAIRARSRLAASSVGAVVLTVLAFARQFASAREAVRALTESAARHNEARFRALVQHSSDVITILDADWRRFATSAPRWPRCSGHEPSRLLGHAAFGAAASGRRRQRDPVPRPTWHGRPVRASRRRFHRARSSANGGSRTPTATG